MNKYNLCLSVGILIIILVTFACTMNIIGACNQSSIDRDVRIEVMVKTLERDILKRSNKNLSNDLATVKAVNRIVTLVDQLHNRKGDINALGK